MWNCLGLIVLAAACTGLIVRAIYEQTRCVKLTENSWKGLVAKLQKVDNQAVEAVAQDFLTPHEGILVMEPEQIWNAVGGYDGIQKMCANADIMIALAAWIREINFDASVIVAERMRRDAVHLRRAARRLAVGQFRQIVSGKMSAAAIFEIQQAAASYYLMRERLFALYKVSLSGLYPRLAEVL